MEDLRQKIAEHERHLTGLKERLAAIETNAAGDTLSASSKGAEPSRRANPGTWPLDLDEYKRYGRQMILPEIGLQGQLSLRGSSVFIIGLGGLGCPAASYLAGAGVGTIGLMDGDTVELSNLHRQILHTTNRVGKLKVESARDGLRQLNPNVKYITHPEHLTPTSALPTFAPYDLILDCTDHPTSRYLISDAAVLARKPLVSASALRTEGQLLVLNHPPTQPGRANGGACYRCVFPKPPPADSVVSCGEGGILGPVVGVMGVLMALEAIKILASKKPVPVPEAHGSVSGDGAVNPMLLFSAHSSPPFRSLRLRGKRSDCISCSAQATITAESLSSGSLDYAVFCGVTSPVNILSGEERISARDFESTRLSEGPYVLIDVRDEPQYGLCRLENSLNIPFSRIDDLGPEAQPSLNDGDQVVEDHLTSVLAQVPPDCPIFTICRFGNDSQLAVRKLKELGYGRDDARKIKDIRGGFKAWKEEVDTGWPEY